MQSDVTVYVNHAGTSHDQKGPSDQEPKLLGIHFPVDPVHRTIAVFGADEGWTHAIAWQAGDCFECDLLALEDLLVG